MIVDVALPRQEDDEKEIQKVVDMKFTAWYDIRVAAKTAVTQKRKEIQFLSNEP
jgi:hypothetical protein